MESGETLGIAAFEIVWWYGFVVLRFCKELLVNGRSVQKSALHPAKQLGKLLDASFDFHAWLTKKMAVFGTWLRDKNCRDRSGGQDDPKKYFGELPGGRRFPV